MLPVPSPSPPLASRAGRLQPNNLKNGTSDIFEPIKLPTSLDVYEGYTFGEASPDKQAEVQHAYEQSLIDNLNKAELSMPGFHIFHLGDVLPTLTEGVQTLVADSFTKCFGAPASESWNWNFYLFPMWCLGLFLRYCVLFPLRLLALMIGSGIISALFVLSSFMTQKKRLNLQLSLMRWLAFTFITSWSGVIRYHGVPPSRAPNQIFVANHTSLIDIIVLMQWQAFAAVGQKHVGFVGFMQQTVLKSLGCLWFERNEQRERTLVAKRIKEHIADASKPPLLIFPEGTCVNNDYCVMFKKGAFEVEGASVFPIAIKYNKIFSNAHWNSKKESFLWHLLRLMTSWSVVCDVWFLDPQSKLPDETAAQFANRVKEMICHKAGLTPVPWDGYLKHVRPSEKFVQVRQKAFAKRLVLRGSSNNLVAMAGNTDNEDEKEEAVPQVTEGRKVAFGPITNAPNGKSPPPPRTKDD